VAVLHYSGPTSGLELTLFSSYNDLEYAVAASSMTDPASAHGAVAVAAIFADDFSGSDPPAEPYSSQGPTTDGRGKPDLAAPDGTSSFTYGPKGAYGTSFAAPVVAGAAALRLQYEPQLDVEALEQLLFDNAIDVGDPGPDATFGYGKIYLPEPASWLMVVAGTGLLGMLYCLRSVR
jgi:subtilisin family serine protease